MKKFSYVLLSVLYVSVFCCFDVSNSFAAKRNQNTADFSSSTKVKSAINKIPDQDARDTSAAYVDSLTSALDKSRDEKKERELEDLDRRIKEAEKNRAEAANEGSAWANTADELNNKETKTEEDWRQIEEAQSNAEYYNRQAQEYAAERDRLREQRDKAAAEYLDDVLATAQAELVRDSAMSDEIARAQNGFPTSVPEHENSSSEKDFHDPKHVISSGGEGFCGDVDSESEDANFVGCTKAKDKKTEYPFANSCTSKVGTKSQIKKECYPEESSSLDDAEADEDPERNKESAQRMIDKIKELVSEELKEYVNSLTEHPCEKWDAPFHAPALGYCPASTDANDNALAVEAPGGVGCNQCTIHVWACAYGICGPMTRGISYNGAKRGLPFGFPLGSLAPVLKRDGCKEIEAEVGNGYISGYALGVWENICDYWEGISLPTGAVNSMPESTYGGYSSGYAAESRIYGTYASHDYAPDAYCDQPRDPMSILYSIYRAYTVWMKFNINAQKWRAKWRARIQEAPGTFHDDEDEKGSTIGCAADYAESRIYGEEATDVQGFWSVSKCKGVLDPAGDAQYGWDERPFVREGTYCGWKWFTSVHPAFGEDVGNAHDGPERNVFDTEKHIHFYTLKQYNEETEKIEETKILITKNSKGEELVCYDPAAKGPANTSQESSTFGVGDPTNRHNENHGRSMTDTRYFLSSELFLYRALQGEFQEFGICEGQHEASLSATTSFCVNNVYDGLGTGDKYRYTLLRLYGAMSGIASGEAPWFSELSMTCEEDRIKLEEETKGKCTTQFCPRIYCGVDNFLTKFDNEGYWFETCAANLSAMKSCETVDRFRCRPIYIMWDNNYDYCSVSFDSATTSLVKLPADKIYLDENKANEICDRQKDYSCKPLDKCTAFRTVEGTTQYDQQTNETEADLKARMAQLCAETDANLGVDEMERTCECCE